MKLGEHFAVNGNELHDKVLLSSIQQSQNFCSPSPWPRPCYFLAKNYFTNGWILMKLGEHFAVDGIALHDNVLLGSIQHSQSFCSPSPSPRPGYFLAKNYFTSGWILMKLGEHLQ